MTDTRIILAPLRGFTERPFREAYSNHFSGIDEVLAPFIPLVSVGSVNPSRFSDILPQNEKIPIIPQVIGNSSQQIIQMAKALYDVGFEEVNWNLGCPMHKITKKQRGSGLLPYPDKIRSILEEVIPAIPGTLSIKTRLGLKEKNEFLNVIDVFNDFPLASLTIHPRTGAQMYSGVADPDFFALAYPKLANNKLIYNGDIFTVSDYRNLQQRFNTIEGWMIGRALIANPFLGEWIKSGQTIWNRERFLAFHNELYDSLGISSTQVKFHLNRIKGYWTLFLHVYSHKEIVKDRILHSKTPQDLFDIAQQIILYEPLNPNGLSLFKS